MQMTAEHIVMGAGVATIYQYSTNFDTHDQANKMVQESQGKHTEKCKKSNKMAQK